jgi:alpha-glucosidase
MDTAHPDVHPLYRDLRKLLDEYSTERPRAMIGEIHVYDWPVWATYYGQNLDEFHLPFNFGLVKCHWDAQTVRGIVDAIENALRDLSGWPNYVLGTHDDHRIATRAGENGARVAMMLLLSLRGTPTIYYGDEIGMHDVDIPKNLIQDPFEVMTPGRGLGRDPERTPMQWDAGPNAGFSAEDVLPWLPVAGDADRVNVASESADPRSILALTSALLRLRRAEPALHRGSYRPVDDVPDDCFVYLREHEGRRFLIALNFASEERAVRTPFERGKIVLSTELDRDGEEGISPMTLRPNEGCIVAVL